MKLSTKFILWVTLVLFLGTGISLVNFYAGGIGVMGEQSQYRVQVVMNLMEDEILQGDSKGIQTTLATVKEKEQDFLKFDIFKLDDAPIIIGSYDESMLGKKAEEAKTLEYLEKAKAGAGAGFPAGDNLEMFVPMKSSDGKVSYVAQVTFALNNSTQSLNSIIFATVIVFSIVMVLIIFLIWFTVNRMVKRPLDRLIASANQIASGDLNIKFGKELKSKDEVGHLARAFYDMTENLKQLIGKINDSAQQVAASAQQLTAGAEQTTQASQHIVETVQEVAVGSERQVSSVEESAKVIEEMSVGVEKISDSARNVSSTVLQASEVAFEGNQSIQTVMRQMNSINNTVLDLHQMVKRLGERSQEIGQIVQVITGIAEQTNLLALNAAIEAARAGENGRGFSVVADEVRKLAVQSASSGQQITQLVETIQEETNVAILSMEDGTKEVAEGISVVNTAGESFQRIQESIDDVVEQIHSVSAAVKQMSAGTGRVVDSIKLIAEIAEETAGNTQLVSASTQEQLASMNEIADSSLALNGMAEELQSLVLNFKM